MVPVVCIEGGNGPDCFSQGLNDGVSDSELVPQKISDFYFSFIDMNQLSQPTRQNEENWN